MDLGWILEVFWEDLALKLKTIRNIFDELLCLRTCVDDQGDEGQINGWMDGWKGTKESIYENTNK